MASPPLRLASTSRPRGITEAMSRAIAQRPRDQSYRTCGKGRTPTRPVQTLTRTADRLWQTMSTHRSTTNGSTLLSELSISLHLTVVDHTAESTTGGRPHLPATPKPTLAIRTFLISPLEPILSRRTALEPTPSTTFTDRGMQSSLEMHCSIDDPKKSHSPSPAPLSVVLPALCG